MDSFLSVRSELNKNGRPHCFELFGYDFLVDESFRIWLIEVNTNPFLGCQNRWHEQLLPKMVCCPLAMALLCPSITRTPATYVCFRACFWCPPG